MLTSPDNIFNIEEDVDMDINDNELDNILNPILDASDGIDQAWEAVGDSDEWIKSLEKSGLSYNRHDCRIKRGEKKACGLKDGIVIVVGNMRALLKKSQ
ncbi:hypothetical protein F8M41_016123 [Gigaspora margarita]|uniref:Uncharacterized protein n=1 Tax=Gigaspora margarita TaxID=4874 RepID=A0A8H3WVX8_GIGMA|nr:hypothetical protein F8M41_016123 [Gigaspora margarita]